MPSTIMLVGEPLGRLIPGGSLTFDLGHPKLHHRNLELLSEGITR